MADEEIPLPSFLAARQVEAPLNYVNGVAILFSPWDFSLLFQRAVPTVPLSEDDSGISQAVVDRVVMSPEHAKAMLAVLDSNLKSYEQEYGEIPTISLTPPDQVQAQAAVRRAPARPARAAKRST